MRTTRSIPAWAVAVATLAVVLALAGCEQEAPQPEEDGPPLEATIVVPDVVDMAEDSATTDLLARGFAVASETQPSDDFAEGTVLSQSLEPGSEVAKETEIVLAVSSGPELVEVPNVVGMYPENAEPLFEAAGLQMDAVSIHGPIDPDAGNADIGEVYRQTPAAGEMVPKGTVVEVRSWWESG